MKISIITATYNSQATLINTLQSILNQSYKNFEYIVVDGASKDNTVSILNQFEKEFEKNKIPFTYITEPDSGIYDAWNKGIKIAKGEWIGFIGADDCYLPNAIENYCQTIKSHEHEVIDLIHSNVEVIDHQGKQIKTIHSNWSWNVFKHYMNIAHIGALHHKNYFKKYGIFNSKYKIVGDYELLLRAKQNLKCIHLNKTTATMGYGGISTINIKSVFKETMQAKQNTAHINRLVCLMDYYIAYLKWNIKKILH